MKYLLSLTFVLILTVTNAIGQTTKKQSTILNKNQISDSTKGGDTLLIMSVGDARALLNWIGSQHIDLQDAKKITQFIENHIIIYPADNPKK